MIGVNTTRVGPFYNVASVELGNTTTKCILLATNLRSADLFEIAKEVRFTRDVRPPAAGEEVFGETLVGVKLTRESVSELVADTLTSVLNSVGMNIENDLHFVVRSTGVTAGFTWQLIAGDQQPLEAQWDASLAVPGASINLGNIGAANDGDTRSYIPFWLRITVPRGATIKSYQGVTLKISATEGLVL